MRIMERFQKYVKILAQNIRTGTTRSVHRAVRVVCFPIAALQLYRSRDRTGVRTGARCLDRTWWFSAMRGIYQAVILVKKQHQSKQRVFRNAFWRKWWSRLVGHHFQYCSWCERGDEPFEFRELREKSWLAEQLAVSGEQLNWSVHTSSRIHITILFMCIIFHHYP